MNGAASRNGIAATPAGATMLFVVALASGDDFSAARISTSAPSKSRNQSPAPSEPAGAETSAMPRRSRRSRNAGMSSAKAPNER
jgi:hypothetical protein